MRYERRRIEYHSCAQGRLAGSDTLVVNGGLELSRSGQTKTWFTVRNENLFTADEFEEANNRSKEEGVCVYFVGTTSCPFQAFARLAVTVRTKLILLLTALTLKIDKTRQDKTSTYETRRQKNRTPGGSSYALLPRNSFHLCLFRETSMVSS